MAASFSPLAAALEHLVHADVADLPHRVELAQDVGLAHPGDDGRLMPDPLGAFQLNGRPVVRSAGRKRESRTRTRRSSNA